MVDNKKQNPMKNGTEDSSLTFPYRFFKSTTENNLNYIYRGIFTQAIIKHILALTESNIHQKGESTKVKKRVYLIMVEGLQNITRHQEVEADSLESSAIFVIQKKGLRYLVTTGNIIPNDKIELLTEQIDKVNSLGEKELKKYYREVLIKGRLSDKGGAGLGLIEMARKSGNKLSYSFKKIDDENSYFYLQTEVFSIETEDEITDQGKYSLESIKNLHNLLNEQNVLLNFNGIFNQDSLMGLLSIIESQMKGRKNVYNIMVEMLQNIVHHGSQCETSDDKEGMFYISQYDKYYLLTAGNYIDNKDIPILRKMLEHVNNMSEEELREYYNSRLLDFENNDSLKTGLGLVEIKLKSKRNINYNFHKIDNNRSFFAMQAHVQVKEALK